MKKTILTVSVIIIASLVIFFGFTKLNNNNTLDTNNNTNLDPAYIFDHDAHHQ